MLIHQPDHHCISDPVCAELSAHGRFRECQEGTEASTGFHCRGITMMKTNRYLIALVVALGLIPMVLDATIVTVVLTPIRDDLRTDVNTIRGLSPTTL